MGWPQPRSRHGLGQDRGAGILEEDARRDELVERGLARAAEFTWDETARKHEDVYRTAASVGFDR